MRRWRILLAAAILVFGTTTALAEEAGDSTQQGTQGGFLKGLTDALGSVAQTGLQEAMDQWLGTYEGRIGQVDLVERRGNSLVLDVTYEKIKRRDGVSVNGRVLEGGFPLDGFETTLSPVSGKRGKVRLTIRKSGSGDGWGVSGGEIESDQVELFLVREGHEDRPFGNLGYDLVKIWSDSEEEETPEDYDYAEGDGAIELAEGETAAGSTGQVATRPFVIPGTVLRPVQVGTSSTAQAAATVQPSSATAAGTSSSPASSAQPLTTAAIPGLQAIKVGSYDFYGQAAKAEWSGSKGVLSFPGSPNDGKGFVRCLANGRIAPNNTAKFLLQTHPTWVQSGIIVGRYPAMTLDSKVHFRAIAAFLKGANASDGATFRVQVEENGRKRTVVRKRVSPNQYVALDADLSSYAGKKVRIILSVAAGKSSAQDWAVWVKPRLEKVGP
ncbi:MAG: hypothetical protein JXK94_00865 [Deltaproteobacteria bacterium]|nr:hypothetical protein [Deltaproteobacteria bacterium]